MNTWNYVLNKKYEINQYVLYFRFLKVATLYFFLVALQTLGVLSVSFMRWSPEGFSLHRCASSGLLSGISCLINGTNGCVVQKSGSYTADSPIEQLLDNVIARTNQLN